MREKSDMSTAISQLRPPGLQCFAFSCVPVSATIPPDGRILRGFTKKTEILSFPERRVISSSLDV